MKKLIFIASVLLASATLVRAGDDVTDSVSTVDLEQLARWLAPARVARGMSPKEVQSSLGVPHAQLAPNVWAYWNFKAKDTPQGEKFDAALVIFAHNRVERVKLCDSKVVRAFLAQQDARAASAAKSAIAAK